MGFLETIRAAFEPTDTGSSTPIVGSYWCYECSIREPVHEKPTAETKPPICPDCTETMQFERSPDSGDCSC